jgi:hypothetical protein
MYSGALDDASLSASPFTGGQYAFGDGNPVSNIEMDGHSFADPGGSSPSSSGLTQAQMAAMRDVILGFAKNVLAEPGRSGDPEAPFLGGIIKGAILEPIDGLVNLIPDQLSKQDHLPPLWHSDLSGAFTSWWDQKFGITPGSVGSVEMNVTSAAAGVASLFIPAADVGEAVGGAAKADEVANSGWLGGLFRRIAGDAATCGAGVSFTRDTRVLLADGTSKPISSLKPGDKVLATNTKTGKTSAEAVAAVEVNHDHDLFDLKVKTSHGIQVIHTTASHLFWDPVAHKWVKAARLRNGQHLRTANGKPAIASGGHVPARHDGWMWDLTIPGNNDHDFYVIPSLVTGGQHMYYVAAGGTPVLVHNVSECGPGDINWNWNSVRTFGHTFNEHGAGPRNLRSLTDRARSTGNPQGQWLNNEAAAEFLSQVYVPGSGPFGVKLPEGLGQVVMPDGTIVDAPYAYVIPNANGVIRTAYPTLGEP